MSDEQQPQDVVVEAKPESSKLIGRNPDGTFIPGFSGNPSGRPKDTLKAFFKKVISDWTDEQKLEFLAKINPLDKWKMAEGNPQTDVTSAGEKLAVIPILGGNSVQQDGSAGEDTQTQQTN